MGKHSAPESPGFWRAVLIAGFKYLVVAAILAGIGFGAYKVLHKTQAPAKQPDTSASGSLSPDPGLQLGTVPEETNVSPLPTASAAATPSAAPSASSPPSPAPSASPVPGTGRVQILDGSGSSIKAAKAKQKIDQSGYEVVFTGKISRVYEQTTIYYQPGNEQLAHDLATVVGASNVAAAPATLKDTTIPVAIVVGSDYPG